MQEQPNITLPSILAAKKAPFSEHKRKILYVEDNAGNRALVEAVIKRYLHLQLFCAATVREGKMMLSEIEPALIIIDLHLADESGEALVEYVKSRPEMANIPIIILSADAMPDTIKRLEAAGIARFITKPIDIALFSQQVLTLTEKPIT
jgi:CheY-like chemotaxis protein